MDLLDEAQEELINIIKDIRWDAVTEQFKDHEYYDEDKKIISVKTEGGSIDYDFGDYVLQFNTSNNKVIACLTDYLFKAENLVTRDEQIYKQLEILKPIETRFLDALNSLKNKIEVQNWQAYRELRLSVIEFFNKRFIHIKNYEQLQISIIDKAIQNDYKVFRWKGSQADLFRFIKLAIALELIEDDKVEISDFIKKHVLCRNLTSKEYQPIVPSELKNTFYSKGRNNLDVKFIKRLKKLIMDKYPE